MQISNIVALLFVTLAVASPSRSKPAKPVNKGQQTATITCGDAAGAYCCNNDAGDESKVTCTANFQQCNTNIICCANNAQHGGEAEQTCGQSLYKGKTVKWE